MTQVCRWRRLDLPAVEDFQEEGRSFHGRVRVEDAVPWSAEYRVTFEEDWTTRSAEITLERSGPPRRMQVRRESSGRWLADGRELEACRGALDIDLGMTPSTNTSAIRRLGLDVGQSAELTAIWVRFPGLEVELLRQRYTRLEPKAYRYESLRDGTTVFQARLDVDSAGLVERYEGIFERIVRPG